MIEKPISRLIQTLEAHSFCLMGSPGQHGLGVSALHAYANGINNSDTDFAVTLGGVSPLGRDPYYRTMAEFIDKVTNKPMYVVPGAGDSQAFTSYFGHRDKAVITEEFLLILLDNSSRSFSEETLHFLRDTLAIAECPHIIVAFHYPPPNRFQGDCMSPEDWAKFEETTGVWRKRISMLVAGWSEIYFEDEVDGLRLVACGGGSPLADTSRALEAGRQLVEFRVDEAGNLVHTRVPVRGLARADRAQEVREHLHNAFHTECLAHVAHLMDAEDAEYRGQPQLARLFRATAESRLRQAKNLRRVLEGTPTAEQSVNNALETLIRENGQIRLDRTEAAVKHNDFMAEEVFHDVAAAGIVNTGLLEKAGAELKKAADIEATEYQVCLSCGVVFAGFSPPEHCSECGAPMEWIIDVR